jgi:hypothetical protein
MNVHPSAGALARRDLRPPSPSRYSESFISS